MEENIDKTEDVKNEAAKPLVIDTGFIYKKLQEKYGDYRRYATAGEVSNATGGYGSRWLDFVVAEIWPSDGMHIHAFEIKISKSDLKHDLENPEKHNIFFPHIDTFSLVCPEKMADLKVLPPSWGLMVCQSDGKLVWRRKPNALHDERRNEINKGFCFSLLRAMCNQNAGRRQLEQIIAEERQKAREEGMESEKRHLQYLEAEVKRDLWKIDFVNACNIYDEATAKSLINKVKNLAAFERQLDWAVHTVTHTVERMEELKRAIVELQNTTTEPVETLNEFRKI